MDRAMSLMIVFLTISALCFLCSIIFSNRSQLVAKRLGHDPGILNLNISAAKRDFVKNGHLLVCQGYQQSENEKFIVQTQDMERLILPPKYLPELRMLPEAKLSHSVALVERHLGYYSGVDVILQNRQHSDVCRVQLTQQLRWHYFAEFGQPLTILTSSPCTPNGGRACSLHVAVSLRRYNQRFYAHIPGWYYANHEADFLKVPTYSYVYSMVLGVSSRVFVGLPLARDERWLQVVSAYLANVVGTANALRPWPRFLRSLVRPFVAPKCEIDTILADALNILGPAIKERQEVQEKQDDLLGFLVETSNVVEPMSIVLKLLVLTSAALHTSTMAAVHTIYDLCENREYFGDLRAEVHTALKENGGVWEHRTIKQLPRLDSFMKESMRRNQPDALAFNRVVMAPIKLSDGSVLPKGTFVNMAAEAMTQDRAYYENPTTFDGYRFFKSSQSNETQPLNEFTGIEPGNLAWGSGRLTCPGRWFASAMNKLIIGSLLADFEIKFPEGQAARPNNIYSNGGVMPDPLQEVLFQKTG